MVKKLEKVLRSKLTKSGKGGITLKKSKMRESNSISKNKSKVKPKECPEKSRERSRERSSRGKTTKRSLNKSDSEED